MSDNSATLNTLAILKTFRRPDYPKADREAGRQGDVWIRVLVDRCGSVREALLYKSSGTQSLDEAALATAPDFLFEPAIKDGRPVSAWVTYRVIYSGRDAIDINVL